VSEAEAGIMVQHAHYRQGLMDRGTAVVFGPVADPAGVWGLDLRPITASPCLQSSLLLDHPRRRHGFGQIRPHTAPRHYRGHRSTRPRPQTAR
jgi:hypothetical protein